MSSGKQAFIRQLNGDSWKKAMERNIMEFAIFSDAKLNEDYYGYKLDNHDTSGFLVTQEGLSGVHIYPFDTIQHLLAAAKKCWVCWVVFNRNAVIIDQGGIGFAHKTCVRNGGLWLSQNLPW